MRWFPVGFLTLMVTVTVTVEVMASLIAFLAMQGEF